MAFGPRAGALRGSHPSVEHELDDSALPGDITADRVIDQAIALLDAVDRYRLKDFATRGRPELRRPPDIDIF
jgi:hypothetical protein